MIEAELSHFLFAAVLLLMAALGSGHLFERLGLPRVVGEICGGIFLGPSLLGWLSPSLSTWLFGDSVSRPLPFFYWAGLILLMFISGFRVQRDFTREDRRKISVIVTFAVVPPFLVGFLAPSIFDLHPYIGAGANILSFQIVCGIAVAVTSIPVISKIFIDLGIINTGFARLVLACATVEDVLLWSALAIATGLNGANGDGATSIDLSQIAGAIFTTFAFLALSLWAAPRLVALIARDRLNPVSRNFPTAYVLAICLLFAGTANVLGINLIFGAFMAGIAVGVLRDERFRAVQDRIAEVSFGFFIPIYFALVGFSVDLARDLDLWFTLGFIVLTSAVKLGCVYLGARVAQSGTLSSLNLAMAMNTRGGPGIVLASVAYADGIIDERFYVALVMAAIITSLVSGVWFQTVVRRGWPL